MGSRQSQVRAPEFRPLESRQVLTLATAGVPRLGCQSPARLLSECPPLLRLLAFQARQWLMTDGVTWGQVVPRERSGQQYDFLRKIVILGSKGCGKSSLAMRLEDPKKDLSSYVMTIGLEITVHRTTVGGLDGCFQVWNTGGDPRFLSVAVGTIRSASGLMVLFEGDGSDLEGQLVNMAPHRRTGCTVLIVGTKADLHGEGYQDVPESVWNIARRFDAHVLPFRTSSYNGLNVELAFALLHTLISEEKRKDS